MTNPFARPDQPDSDDTTPLVPDPGQFDLPSPWSSGYEATAVDPLAGQAQPAGGSYTNPVIPPSGDHGQPAAPAPSPAPLPPTAPSPYGSPTTTADAPMPTYEQPPLAYGAGPYEAPRDSSLVPTVPAYSYVYAPQQIDHPNAVPTLVLGVLGFVFGVTFPIAWFLGAKGNADIKREPQRYRSSPMMTVGMILGAIGTVFMALAVIAIVLLVVAAIAMT